MGQVYVLHFDQAYHHAKHYIGYVDGNCPSDIQNRMKDHREGRGARIMDVITKAGIGFTIAWIYEGVDRKFERKLKNRGGASRHCCMCKADRMRADFMNRKPNQLDMNKLTITENICSILERRHPHPVPHPNKGMDDHETSWQICVVFHFPVVGQPELQKETLVIRKTGFANFKNDTIGNGIRWMNIKLDIVRKELKVIKNDGTTFDIDANRISELGLSPVPTLKLAEFESKFYEAVDAILPEPPLWDENGVWYDKPTNN